MWSTSNAFGLFANVGGLKVGLVHARDCALNDTASITDLVIVDAERKSDSGGEVMWKPSADMSKGKESRVRYLEATDSYRNAVLYEITQHKPNQRQVESTPIL